MEEDPMKDPRKARILDVVTEYITELLTFIHVDSAADLRDHLRSAERRQWMDQFTVDYLQDPGRPLQSLGCNVLALMQDGKSNSILRQNFRDAVHTDPLPVVLLNWPSFRNQFLIAISRNTLGVDTHTHHNGHIEIRYYVKNGKVWRVTVVFTETGKRHQHPPIEDGSELFVINISPEPFLALPLHPVRTLVRLGEIFPHSEL